MTSGILEHIWLPYVKGLYRHTHYDTDINLGDRLPSVVHCCLLSRPVLLFALKTDFLFKFWIIFLSSQSFWCIRRWNEHLSSGCSTVDLPSVYNFRKLCSEFLRPPWVFIWGSESVLNYNASASDIILNTWVNRHEICKCLLQKCFCKISRCS
jgi:hypothetical protein